MKLKTVEIENYRKIEHPGLLLDRSLIVPHGSKHVRKYERAERNYRWIGRQSEVLARRCENSFSHNRPAQERTVRGVALTTTERVR